MKQHTRKPNPRDDRKAKQLCRQVGRAIEYALSSDCGDERLLGLSVVEVLPAPNTGHLLVILQSSDNDNERSPKVILQLLNRHLGLLRAAVAMTISRRRTPMLAFQVVYSVPAD